MARLALEHLIEFLDGLAEFLATIQLIGHQEVIENLVEGSALGRLARPAPLPRDRRACSGSAPAAGETPGRACRAAGPVRGNSGPCAGTVPFRPASGRTRTGLRSRRESAGADSNRPGSRPSGHRSGRHRVWGERPRDSSDAVDGQRLLDRGARGFQIGGQIHAGVQRAQELGFVADGDELLEAGPETPAGRPRRAALARPVSSSAWAGSFKFSTGASPPMVVKAFSRSSRALDQSLAATATRALSNSFCPSCCTSDSRCSSTRVVLPLPGPALFRQCHVQLAAQRDVVPDDKQHHAQRRPAA